MDFVSIMKQTAIRIAYTSCKFVPRGWLVRAVKPRRAAVQPRSRGHGCGMLSPGLERGAALPKPLRDPVCRPQPSAQSPKEEAAKGAEGRRREEKTEEGGPNARIPQRTLPGSNPAWALFQHRKLPAVRLESNAGRLINRQQQHGEKKGEWKQKGKSRENSSGLCVKR